MRKTLLPLGEGALVDGAEVTRHCISVHNARFNELNEPQRLAFEAQAAIERSTRSAALFNDVRHAHASLALLEQRRLQMRCEGSHITYIIVTALGRGVVVVVVVAGVMVLCINIVVSGVAVTASSIRVIGSSSISSSSKVKCSNTSISNANRSNSRVKSKSGRAMISTCISRRNSSC
jgi:hypothetical protein